jgi:beta-glucosidase
MEVQNMPFRKDFAWGAATAAIQVEGAIREDGRGSSIWEECSALSGRIQDGQTCSVACDHYHRYKEDVAIMKEIGIDAYRFSISWPRVIPEGTGEINEKGLDFYDRLVDELLEKGITPYATLFHWDLPYELYRKGGWLNRDSAEWFAEYADAVVSRLSDRVSHWMTINEPQCFIGVGMQEGRHAPFLTLTRREVLTAVHNVLLAHGGAVKAIRAAAKTAPLIGYAPTGSVVCPASSRPEDVEAARGEMFRTDNGFVRSAAWWSDPMFFGKYPEDGAKCYEADMPDIRTGDMELIRQPLDFYGANIYNAPAVRAGVGGKAEPVRLCDGFPTTSFDWAVTPDSLYWGARFLYERYKKPIVITENGMANSDWVMEDGRVHDPQRIDYMSRYLKSLERAADDGVDIAGYFAWSLLDNFEWALGYSRRFGMVYVDFVTQKRTPKDSAYWYRDYIAARRAKQ